MGGHSEPPFLYEPQNRRIAYPYSDFNPKAVTQASYQKLQQQQSQTPEKKNGPLINFNQHPDSYMIVSGQNVNYKPMSPNTKKKVTVIRWVQFALRILEEIGALGMLVAVICVKDMITSMAWIARIAPAWDAVITIYAIYHLARSAKARPPMSSASYHMFAIFMDVGLIPFYVFIAIFANQNYYMAPTKEDAEVQRWSSFFPEGYATDTVIYTAFIGCIVMAGLHAISAVIDLWLVVLFRKIAKLPPDLNPLEDNLTSRQASKHKYKNSEATLTGSVDEKDAINAKYMSGSTLFTDPQSRLSTPVKEVPEARQVPFRHSRTGSELGYSPHNPDSARWSRQQMGELSMYEQPQSARGSMASVRPPHSRGNSMSPSKHTFTMTETPPTPMHSSRPISYPIHQNTGTSNSTRNSAPDFPSAAPSNAFIRSQQRDGLLQQGTNWVTFDDENIDPPPRNPNRHSMTRISRHDSFDPQPLKMNPPTPPPPSSTRNSNPTNRSALAPRNDNGNADLNRHLTVLSNATASSSVYSESAPSLKSSRNVDSPTSKRNRSPDTPKSKYYGDLAAATRGVLHSGKSQETFRTVDAAGHDATGMSALGSYGYGYAVSTDELPASPAKAKPRAYQQEVDKRAAHFKSNETLKSNATVEASGWDSTGQSAMGAYGFAAPSPPPKVPRVKRDGQGRVVSRTGVDLADASQSWMKAGRRRDVSGKVAEEGRVGGGATWVEY